MECWLGCFELPKLRARKKREGQKKGRNAAPKRRSVTAGIVEAKVVRSGVRLYR